MLTEDNVLDIYKKLTNNENPTEEEKKAVIKRFNELVNYKGGSQL